MHQLFRNLNYKSQDIGGSIYDGKPEGKSVGEVINSQWLFLFVYKLLSEQLSKSPYSVDVHDAKVED